MANVNYASKSSKATIRKQQLILSILDQVRSMTVGDVAEYLGISRPLAHYHLRKMAYSRQIIMMFEPAPNGQLRIRIVPVNQEFLQAAERLAA